jgi:hypothetical protein
MGKKHEPRDLGNGTSVVFVNGEKAGLPYSGWFVISNTEVPDPYSRPILRGPKVTEAEAEAASLAITWTEEILAEAYPKA